jgi:NAD(P)-dependent dehydrogenase (short-subunit alcohol dehydrogenase family)
MASADEPRPLEGQAAIVTGASSGLGAATAVALARAGASVALIARSIPDLERVAHTMAEQGGGRHLVLPLDLADEHEIAAGVDRVLESFGRIDALVNNAATDVGGQVVDLAPRDWDRVLAVNLRAPFLLSRTVFPHMRRAGRGTIVNISSVAGKRGWASASAYCASKFGLTGLTQALAAEGKPHGIRACVVYPGAMATNWGSWSPEERDREARRAQPPEEALPPEHVAALIVWIVAAPPELVLNEVVATPLHERGWP